MSARLVSTPSSDGNKDTESSLGTLEGIDILCDRWFENKSSSPPPNSIFSERSSTDMMSRLGKVVSLIAEQIKVHVTVPRKQLLGKCVMFSPVPSSTLSSRFDIQAQVPGENSPPLEISKF